MNIPSFISISGRLSILIILSSFASFSAAQKAKFVEIDAWGSNYYSSDTVIIGDYAFHPQANSNVVDVQSLDINEQDALITQLKFDQRVLWIYSFDELLVVAQERSLGFYNIDSLDEPELVYEISIDGAFSYGNSFYADSGRIVYADASNKIYLIDYLGEEFELVGLYQGYDNDYDERIYHYIKAVGVVGDDVFVAYNRQDYGNGTDVERAFFIEKLNYTGTELISEFIFRDADEESFENVVYMTDGNFSAITDRYAFSTFTLLSDSYVRTDSAETSFILGSADMVYSDQKLYIPVIRPSLLEVDVSDPTSINIEEPKLIRNGTNSLYIFHLFIDNGRYFLRNSRFFGEMVKDEVGNLDATPFYFQSGTTGIPALIDDKIYVVKENSIHELDVSDPANLAHQRSVFVDDHRTYNNLLVNNDAVFIGTNSSTFYTSEISQILNTEAYIQIDPPESGELVSEYVIDDAIFARGYNDSTLYRYKANSHFAPIEAPESIELDTGKDLYSMERFIEASGHVVLKFNGEWQNLYYFENSPEISDVKPKVLPFESYINSYAGSEDFLFVLLSDEIQIWQIVNNESALVNSYSFSELEIRGSVSHLTIVDGYLIAGTLRYNENDTTYLYEVSSEGDLTFISSTTLSFGVNWDNSSRFIENQGIFYETSIYSGTVEAFQINKGPSSDSVMLNVEEDSLVSFSLVATDPEGDSLSVDLSEASEEGLLTIEEGTLDLVFVPNENFTGETSARVLVKDVHENSVEVELTFTVEPVNDAPELTELSLEVNEDSQLSSVIAATDVDGDSLTYEVVTAPANGTIELLADGSLTYQPNENFFGTDTFEVQFTDGNSDPVTQTVIIEVAPVNDMPVAASATLSGDVTEGRSVTMELGITDMDDDAMTYTVTSEAAKGAVSVSSSGVVTYTANTGTSGSDSFVVTASDGMGGEVSVNLTVNISQAPVINNGGDSSGGGGSMPISVLMGMLLLSVFRGLAARKH